MNGKLWLPFKRKKLDYLLFRLDIRCRLYTSNTMNKVDLDLI